VITQPDIVKSAALKFWRHELSLYRVPSFASAVRRMLPLANLTVESGKLGGHAKIGRAIQRPTGPTLAKISSKFLLRIVQICFQPISELGETLKSI
jgi:hypothetical protein